MFQEVLDKDPTDVNSLKQIAAIYFSIASPSNPKQQRVNSSMPKLGRKRSWRWIRRILRLLTP